MSVKACNTTNLLITNSALPDNKFNQFVAALKLQVLMMSHGCNALGKHVTDLKNDQN